MAKNASATYFELMAAAAASSDAVAQGNRDAIEWFMERIKDLEKVIPKEIVGMTDRHRQNLFLGSMYFYYYDPAGKNTLPYYDRFPLVIPFRRFRTGWIGLNFHYLPMPIRIRLLDKLMPLVSRDDLSEMARLRINWKILTKTAKYKEIYPCVRRYSTNHLRSKLIKIRPVDWILAMALPVAQFRKARDQAIWAKSRQIIKDNI